MRSAPAVWLWPGGSLAGGSRAERAVGLRVGGVRSGLAVRAGSPLSLCTGALFSSLPSLFPGILTVVVAFPNGDLAGLACWSLCSSLSSAPFPPPRFWGFSFLFTPWFSFGFFLPLSFAFLPMGPSFGMGGFPPPPLVGSFGALEIPMCPMVGRVVWRISLLATGSVGVVSSWLGSWWVGLSWPWGDGGVFILPNVGGGWKTRVGGEKKSSWLGSQWVGLAWPWGVRGVSSLPKEGGGW